MGLFKFIRGLFQKDRDESSVKWAKLVRQFIALQKVEYLNESIAEAKKIGETEITTILRAWFSGDLENVLRRIEPNVQRLQTANQQEEALTLILITLFFRASLTEGFRQFPIEQQMKALQSGIDACQQGVQISQILNDQACEATILILMAGGFQEIKQLERAGQLYFEALVVLG